MSIFFRNLSLIPEVISCDNFSGIKHFNLKPASAESTKPVDWSRGNRIAGSVYDNMFIFFCDNVVPKLLYKTFVATAIWILPVIRFAIKLFPANNTNRFMFSFLNVLSNLIHVAYLRYLSSANWVWTPTSQTTNPSKIFSIYCHFEWILTNNWLP